jgi:hypothetical protein
MPRDISGAAHMLRRNKPASWASPAERPAGGQEERDE